MKFLFAFLVFSCLLLTSTFFQADSIQTKSTKSSAVAYFNAWTIGWNADRLQAGLKGYWDSPIFYPVDNTFALSEPQPATMLVAPFVWISDSPLLAYKAWLIFSLVGNALAGVLICRRLGYCEVTQWVGGFSMILLPLCQQQIDVIQLVPIWGILWFLSCLFLLNQQASYWRGAECGCAFATCFYLCLHHSLFLSLVMAVACIVFLPKVTSLHFISSAAVAVVVAAILVLPIILPVLQITKQHNFVRSDRLVEKLSAHPVDYIASQDNSWLDPLNWFSELKPDTHPSRRFHIGWVRMFFAVASIALAFRRKHNRRWTTFLILICCSGFAFSLGPHFEIAGWKPWQTIQQNVPGFQQVRNVFRFAWFVQISVMLLAIAGFDALFKEFIQRRKTHGRSHCRTAMVFVIALVLIAEVWPQPATAHYVPPAHKHQKWVNFVYRECPAGQPIVCLPMSMGNRLADMEIETRWMLLGLGHSIPMLNGYSGFFPSSYQQVVDIVNNDKASDELFAELMKRRVGLIVVARGFPITNDIRNFQSDSFVVEHLFSDDIGVDIYRFRLKP